MPRLATLLSLSILSPLPLVAVAQGSAGSAKQSTRDGVYTVAQAERGRIMYAGMCKSCHTGNHTGAAFAKVWKNHSVEDLFAYTSTKMPKNSPGGMNPDEYLDVVAYLLKLNALPPGSTELPADSAALSAIVIELPGKAANPTTRSTRMSSPPKGRKP